MTSDSGIQSYPKTHVGHRRATLLEAVPPSGEGSAIGRMPLQVAGYQALRLYYKRLWNELAGLRQIDDADSIHDARVAARELRAMSKLLEPSRCFDRRWLRQLDNGLRPLAQVLGQVRDADVLLEHLDTYVEQHKTKGLVWLQDELSWRRARAARQVLKVLSRKETRRLLRQTNLQLRRLDKPPQTAGANARGGGFEPKYPILMRHFAGSAIWVRYQEKLGYEGALRGMSQDGTGS